MKLESITARLDAAAERIPPLHQRFADALPHVLALDFVDVSQWAEPPEEYSENFNLAGWLLACFVAFDEVAFADLLDDLRDASDLTAATWRLKLHVAQHPPSSDVPGEDGWVSFLRHVSDGFYDLMPGQHVDLADDEQERLLARLLDQLRADLKAGRRYSPEWVRFVELAEQGVFA